VTRRAATLCLALVGLTLVGCAALRGHDEARMRAQAETDDAACVAGGLRYPSDAYTSCRLMLAEQRQRKQWMELALVQQQERERTPSTLPVAPPGVYLSIDPDRFRCEQRGDPAGGHVDCRER